MRRPPSRPIRLLSTGLAVLIALLAAMPAYAGFGDMVKKIKDKASQATTKKPAEAASGDCAGKQPVFDDVTLQLTNERIEKILETFKSAGDAAAGRSALVDRLNQATDESRKIQDKRGQAIQDARSKRDEVQGCYQHGYQAAQERRAQEYAQRVLSGDPKLLQKYSKAAQQDNAKAAQGDTAAQARIMNVIHNETAATREDSIEVRKSCGSIPPMMAEETRLEELDKEIAQLNNQIATIDAKVAKAQAKQGGMTDQQWAMALERIQAYLTWKRDKQSSKLCWLTEAEIQVLEKRFEQLKATLG